MLLVELEKRGLINPPTFLVSNTQYLCRMGSSAYGVSQDNSDLDIYGVCIPPRDYIFPPNYIEGFDNRDLTFHHWERHHLHDPSANGGKGCNYDFSIHNIVDYFKLCMNNNPNVIDSLFVSRESIIHITPSWEIIRDNRKEFLHKGIAHKLKSYAYSQLSKARNSIGFLQPILNFEKENGIPQSTTYEQAISGIYQVNKTDPHDYGTYGGHSDYIKLWEEGMKKTTRFENQKIHGQDCYEDASTEFLTENGWKKYSDITTEKLATININSNELEFQNYSNRIKKKYTGIIYNMKANHHSCSITENHNVLISNAHRGTCGYSYNKDNSNWQLLQLSNILAGNKSWFHIKKRPSERLKEYDISDEYLSLAGLFLSEGSIHFRNKKVKNISICQTVNGKPELIEKIITDTKYVYKKYETKKEISYYFGKELAKKIYNDFNYGKNKKIPNWCYSLSHRQAKILWNSWEAGDGSRTTKDNGSVIYSSIENLASSLQGVMVSSGFICTLRGPYFYENDNSFGSCNMWQVYLPDDQNEASCMSFKRFKNNNHTYASEKINVENIDVVCFEVPNGTLITRNNGSIAIHGNCKFLYHIYRLADQAEYILTHHDLDLQERGRVEKMKAIRKGEVPFSDIVKQFGEAESRISNLYNTSELRSHPDVPKIRALLVNCLEHHYGSLEKYLKTADAAVIAVNEIKEVLRKYGQ